MLARALSDDAARARLAEAVGEAERHTSAEVVVAVRRQASTYVAAHVRGGVVASCVVLLCLLFLPQPFDVRFFPIELTLAFGFGALAVALSTPLRRVLSPLESRREALRVAAERAFDELGVFRTESRGGVLVFVGLLEGGVHLVPDVGLDASILQRDSSPAARQLDDAARAHDPEALARALVALGKELGARYPRTADDVNELADEVRS